MIDYKKLQDFTEKYLDMATNTPADSLVQDDAEKIYASLIDILGQHNHLYYIKSQPIIADGQYDTLFAYLTSIEKQFPHIIREDSPTQRLTRQVQGEFFQAQHETPLLSLENSYDAGDLADRDTSLLRIFQKEAIEQYSFICEPKYDGVSLELIYEQGELKKAITRGDGYVGEDVTANIKTLFSVPLKLTGGKNIPALRVRGEVVMSKKSLERVNEERQQQDEPLFANVRNAASGSLRQLDTGITAKRGLTFYGYEILSIQLEQQNEVLFADGKSTEGVSVSSSVSTYFPTDTKALQWLQQQGFIMHNWLKHCKSIHEVIEICQAQTTKNYFDNEDIEFDGIVVKIDELSIREKLGTTNHHPRWAMAYKFPTKQVVTQIMSVDFQVGRTGVVTPTANLQPIELGGVKISRASLHNFDFITDKDIRIGDWVWLQRSGEVIPYVIAAIPERRIGTEQEISIPTHCPICNGPVEKGKSDIYVYCTNPHCPAKLKGQLIYFVSRNGVNIEGLGDAMIDLLVEQKIVKTIADLYILDDSQVRLQLLSQAGIGQKKYFEIIQEIKKSKIAPLRKLLSSLGITHVGSKTAQIIVDAIDNDLQTQEKDKEQFSIYDLESYLTDKEFMMSIKGIGPETVIALHQRFANEFNREILEEMAERGVQWNIFSTKRTIKGKLTGVSFCITGTFGLPRKVIVDILTKHGALVSENITQQTSYLIAGEDPSSKITKAQDSGLPIIYGLDRLEQKFDFLKNDIGSMKLFATKEKKVEKPRQEGLFG